MLSSLGGGSSTEMRRARACSRRRSLAVTWAIVVLGVVGSVAIGSLWSSVVSARSRASFRDTAQSAASAVVTATDRDVDFVVAQQALFSALPGLTNATYRRWYGVIDVRTRYPGGDGFTFVEKVPADRLRAFAETVAKDPLANVPTPAPDHYTPYPPVAEQTYCLPRIGVYTGTTSQPDVATFNFCAPLGSLTDFPPALATAASTGEPTIAPPIAAVPGLFYIVAPVYREGAPLATATERRRAVRGWALGTFDGSRTLAFALGSVGGVSVRLTYLPAHGRPVEIASAGAPAAADAFRRRSPAGVGGSWSIVVTGGTSGSSAAEGAAVGLMVAALAALSFALARLLVRSRERALRLVEQRTGELRHQALHDALTGLPNRALIVDRAEQMLAHADREALSMGVLFLDLDNFKDINDGFGHHIGDALLVAVASRLRVALRPSDSVGRLGGDEFVILVAGASLDAGPEVVAERVLEILDEPFELDVLPQVALTVRASIGVAVGTRPDANELLRDADVALYRAKQRGKAGYVLFHPDMQLAVQDRLIFEMDLRAALANRELYVEYQPTFDIHDLSITGVEALARWRHPTRGLVSPDEFIPIAEQSGLIGPIGRFVLETSCDQAAAWMRAGRRVPVAVNVSGRQLDSSWFHDDVAEVIGTSGLDPDLLTLELTETVLMRDAEATRARLHELKQLGVRIAVDDFGTGYSSLAYLRQFPVDVLKIDGSFVAEIAHSHEARSLVHTLVQLGRTLGLRLVAEGIEEPAQLAELKRERCDDGQGFLYSRPVSAEAIEALLASAETPISAVRERWLDTRKAGS